MNRERLSLNIKVGTIVLGAVCFGLALFTLPNHTYSMGFLLVLAFDAGSAEDEPDLAALEICNQFFRRVDLPYVFALRREGCDSRCHA